MTTITMYDSIEIAQIPSGATAVAGYVSGRWPTAAKLSALFPHARVLTVATSASHDAECLDIETGDATPADAAGWYGRQKTRGIIRPCLYASASVMQADVVPVIRAAGFARGDVRLWSAHFTGEPHICGPSSCGAMSILADGTQWTDRAMGRNLDESLLVANFFGSPPAPKPAPKPASSVREWVTQGQGSLAALASSQHTTPAVILALTAQHGGYAGQFAAYVNAVLDGTAAPAALMPAGLVLYLPA